MERMSTRSGAITIEALTDQCKRNRPTWRSQSIGEVYKWWIW
jgi:hypothetical protein